MIIYKMKSENKKIIGGGGGLLLKPCPICNGEVKISHDLSWGKRYPVIQCEECHLRIGLNWVLGGMTEKESFLKIVEFWGKITGTYDCNANKSIIKTGNIITEYNYINA